jgi:hypothetical protein
MFKGRNSIEVLETWTQFILHVSWFVIYPVWFVIYPAWAWAWWDSWVLKTNPTATVMLACHPAVTVCELPVTWWLVWTETFHTNFCSTWPWLMMEEHFGIILQLPVISITQCSRPMQSWVQNQEKTSEDPEAGTTTHKVPHLRTVGCFMGCLVQHVWDLPGIYKQSKIVEISVAHITEWQTGPSLPVKFTQLWHSDSQTLKLDPSHFLYPMKALRLQIWVPWKVFSYCRF